MIKKLYKTKIIIWLVMRRLILKLELTSSFGAPWIIRARLEGHLTFNIYIYIYIYIYICICTLFTVTFENIYLRLIYSTDVLPRHVCAMCP